jgi:hypothetical protein
MPVGYETIDYNNIELALKRSWNVHSSFQCEDVLQDGVDAHFMARVRRIDTGQMMDNASKYWYITNYNTLDGYMVIPRDYNLVGVYSRRTFMYPHIYAWTVLPDMRRVGDESYFNFYIGLETGNSAMNGIASFVLLSYPGSSNVLYAYAGPLHGVAQVKIDVAKPTDFNSAKHHYRIIHSRPLTIFLIDQRIRLIAIQSAEGTYVKVKENVLPYSIALIPHMPATLRALVELLAGGRVTPASEDLYAPLSPAWIRFNDGKDIVPLQLPLYLDNQDTTLIGYSISSGSVTSHPFPIWGYTYKTLLFMANQSGTLEIDVYTTSGNWRVYDTVNVSANTLLKYRFQDTFPLARVVFTPNTYPATISDAEIDLS